MSRRVTGPPPAPSPEQGETGEKALAQIVARGGREGVVRALARFLYEEEKERSRMGTLRKVGS